MTVAGTTNQSARTPSRRRGHFEGHGFAEAADSSGEPRLGWPQTLLRGSFPSLVAAYGSSNERIHAPRRRFSAQATLRPTIESPIGRIEARVTARKRPVRASRT